MRSIPPVGLVLLVAAMLSGSTRTVVASEAGGTVTAAQDSSGTRARLTRQVERFFLDWRELWLRSERDDRGSHAGPSLDGPVATRFRNVHCHFDGSFNGREGDYYQHGPPPNLIRSAFTTFSVCPDWYSARAQRRPDASEVMDNALLPHYVGQAAALRTAVISALDSAALRFPGDGWITGQRVRFRLDANDLSGAMSAARSCGADRPVCANLEGLARYRQGDIAAADRLFMEAERALPAAQRCDWSSIAMLLSADGARDYRELDCRTQLDVVRWFWWLADPLYQDNVNERRAAHYARRVRLALHTAVAVDGLYSFSRNAGTDAVQSMLLRYGWPYYAWWGGVATDEGHSEWLKSDHAAPYSAPEYTLGRISTAPVLDAVLDPLSVTNDDYYLSPRPGLEPEMWWPREHFAWSEGSLAPVDAGQAAFFRRDSSTMMLLATTVGGAHFARNVGQDADATLAISPLPDSTFVAASARTAFGQRLLLRASLDTMAGLGGVEVKARSARSTGRSRYGIVVPAPLAKLGTSRAVSAPLLYAPGGRDMEVVTGLDAIAEQMLAGTLLTSPLRVGVYWESYGFERGDSVTVSVKVQRITTPGRLQRLTIALGLSSDPNSAVAISWTEPQPGRSSTSIAGLVPILGRQLIVDMAPLISGDYRLEVSMQSPGQPAVTNTRFFSIAR